ncbi:hypothetical protein [Paraconexibacter algicola]|uniref:Uncharacterized protein n=1 Tax=Paraconexibacter algicola TaxID=2133960 RepID=A0A2T4UMC7_9ACTN|nr:hypothetical protein [Paraconexibacter algicola]PTL60392.1 hypothetical protein C7Y72_12450 [Paraconexibacter algicola]
MDRARLRQLWDRGQHGWPRSYPVAQFPNAPLLVYLAAWLGRQLSDGDTRTAFDALGRVALACWAYDELRYGVNLFRRGLGAVALVAITVGLAADLG